MSTRVLLLVLCFLFNKVFLNAQLRRIDQFGTYTEKITDTTTIREIFMDDALTNYSKDNLSDKIERKITLFPPLRRMAITSEYGIRRHPVIGGWKFHGGIDLAANFEDVFCIADGIVKEAGYNRISGYYIIVEHGLVTSSYCHLNRIDRRRGQSVKGGNILGQSGNTGRCSGPHLHFALRFREGKIDPKTFIRLIGL